MTDISTKTIKAVITNTTPTFKASIVQKGDNGKEVEFQTTATHIQWRYVDGTWADLVALADLKGADGTNGIDGDDGNGIASITLASGDHSPGTSDTYTITFDDLTTTTFDVYNGADGSGNMMKSVYDTNDDGIIDKASLLVNAIENNAKIETLDTGTKVSRNIVDTNPALSVDNVLGTGNIQEFKQGGSLVGFVDKNGTIGGGVEQTVDNKNKYLPLLKDILGNVVAKKLTYYWNGSAYATHEAYGFGYAALQNNTGVNSNGFGHTALYSNIGGYSNGFGRSALQNNTGANSNGFGHTALQNNTGVNSNGFGYAALQSNTGANSNGFGYYALRYNKGAYNTAVGHNANGIENATTNAFTNTTCLGANTVPNKSNQVVLGSADVDTVKMGGTYRTPASSTDTGVKGEFCYDDTYLYLCVATDTWKRIRISTDGVFSDLYNNYSLPTATDSVLGGVKIGAGINIASGVINANGKQDVTTITADTTSTTPTVSLVTNNEYVFSDDAITTLGITLSSGYTVGFIASVVFVSPASAPTVTLTNTGSYTIATKGDGTWAGLVLTPTVSKTVTMIFNYDGINMNIYVSEV